MSDMDLAGDNTSYVRHCECSIFGFANLMTARASRVKHTTASYEHFEGCSCWNAPIPTQHNLESCQPLLILWGLLHMKGLELAS